MNDFMELLKRTIKNNENKITNYEEEESIIYTYKNKTSSLKNDINNLIDYDIDDIKKIISKLDISNKEEVFDNIKTIKDLLTLNKIINTTYEISPLQLKYLNIFIDSLDKYNNKNSNIEEVKIKNNKYNNILDRITNKKYIEDIDTINLLLDDNNYYDKERREVLFTIMRYNKTCYK